MLQVKRLQLETPDWNAAGHPSQARRPDDGFEAVFHTIRQDFSESARTAAAQRNAEGQRRIEEVKPDSCGKKEKPDGELEIEAENGFEEPSLENDIIPAESEEEPVVSERPVEETVEPVEGESEAEGEGEVGVDVNAVVEAEEAVYPAAIEFSASAEVTDAQKLIISLPGAVKETELLLQLAGQANAKMVREQIAGWNASSQPVLAKPQTAPQMDSVPFLNGNAAVETNGRSEAAVLELELPIEPAAEEQSNPGMVLIKEPVRVPQTGDPAEQKPAVMAAVPVEKEQPQPESKPVVQTRPDVPVAVGEEEKQPESQMDSPSDFQPEDRRHTGLSQTGEKPVVRGYAEAAQAAANPPAHRAGEPEKKQPVSGEAVAVDPLKNLITDKSHSVPQKSLASPSAVPSAAAAAGGELKENMDQMVKSVQVAQAQGGSRVQLRLDPPELGMLRIEMRQTENGLMLQMQASTPKAQQMLQQSSGELRAALESQGFPNTQIEVQLRLDLRNDSTSQNYREREQEQESMFQQQAGQFGSPQQDGQGEYAGWPSEGDVFPEEELIPPDADKAAENGKQTVSHPEWQELAFASLDIRI